MRAVVLAALLSQLLWAQTPDAKQLFASAMEAQQRGDLPTAVQRYQQVVAVAPDVFAAWANLGVVLAHLGRFDEAIAAYRSALKLDASNGAIRMNLALAFYKKGDPRQAALELKALLAAEPENLRIATLLGDCYIQLGQNDQALAITAPLARSHPDDLDLAYVLGSALIGAGKAAEGLPLVERVAIERNNAAAYALAGKTWLKDGDPEKAVRDLEKAAQLNPGLPGIYTLRGVAREGTLNNTGAEEDLRKALAQNPEDVEAAIHLGGILYARRELAEAKTYLDRALKRDPSNLFAVYEMALWKSASGKVEEAARDLEMVVRRDPNWMQAHVQLAALYYRLNRPEDGQKERVIVERLSAEQQKAEAATIRQH